MCAVRMRILVRAFSLLVYFLRQVCPLYWLRYCLIALQRLFSRNDHVILVMSRDFNAALCAFSASFSGAIQSCVVFFLFVLDDGMNKSTTILIINV